jgi:uracil-DNA glycosylase
VVGQDPIGAEAYLPVRRDLSSLARAVQGCRGCDLYADATQAVFGEGAARADLMLVGEQPGDREDLDGRPFVGPAGHVLDEGLERAGLERRHVYVTNAVKHFRFEPRGRKRIHRRPDLYEVLACRPWLEAEIDRVRPTVLVCMGATAARSLLGSDFRVTKQRGTFVPADVRAEWVTATVHPSSILRGPPEQRNEAMAAFVADLRVAARKLEATA